MRNILLAVFVALYALGVNAQTEIEPFVPGVTTDGVRYFLPRTAFRVVIIVEKTVTIPGNLNKYAYKYLHLQNVPTQTTTEYRIKSIELQPYGVPDKTKAYNIKLKNRTVAPMLSLTRDGVLMGVNTEVSEDVLPPLPEAVPAPALLDARKYMNQEMLMASSTAKLAELVAEEIYDIRSSRNDLVRGEADNTPKDGEQLQLMLRNLDDQDAALSAMFSGQVSKSTEVFHMQLNPNSPVDKMILCRFSKPFGLVGSDDLSGEPIYVSIKHTDSMPDSAAVATNQDKKRQQGIFCNVPVPATFTVFDASQQYTSTTIPVAQFGTTDILGASYFDKNATTAVVFHQSTGGVKEIRK